MNQFITITLPDGQVVEGHIHETISHRNDDEFYLFTCSEVNSDEQIVVRVETNEARDDRVARGCVD